MAKAFKFRHVNEVAGGFVLAGVAMLLVTVVMMGRAQHWFTGTRLVTLQLPSEGTFGLKPGADVRILGTVVGSVRNINMDPDGRMSAQASIQSDFAGFVRQDSTASIEQPTLGIGEPYIVIVKGSGAALEGDKSVPTLLKTSDMEATLTQIRLEAVPAIQDVRRALVEYRQLAADLRNPAGDLQQTIAHANRITSSVDRGEGLAGKVLTDPTMADQITRAIPKLNASLDEIQGVAQDLHKSSAALPEMASSANEEMKKLPALVDQTRQTLQEIQGVMRDIQKFTAAMPETAKSINQTAEALPGLVVQMQETMRQIQRVVEGAQRSWLFRGGMSPDEPSGRIRPDQIDTGGR